jgi:DNA-binding FrmR family transcriptional regulator
LTVELPDEVVDDLRKRLRRADGQVRAVERMLAEGRECKDVVTQLSAAISALEQAGFRLVASGLTYCIQHPEEAAASGYPLDEVQRMFTKLA